MLGPQQNGWHSRARNARMLEHRRVCRETKAPEGAMLQPDLEACGTWQLLIAGLIALLTIPLTGLTGVLPIMNKGIVPVIRSYEVPWASKYARREQQTPTVHEDPACCIFPNRPQKRRVASL